VADKFKEQINFMVFGDFGNIKIKLIFESLSIKTIPLYHKSGNGEEITNHGFLIKETGISNEVIANEA
jgi:hypothetical protein